MPKTALCAMCMLVVLQAPQVSSQSGAVPIGRFAGTWVGTQAWAIPDAPPGARNDQPVALTLEVVDERLVGVMRPFLGGEDGATIVSSRVVGEALHATAVLGPPRSGPPRGWKDSVTVTFVFTGDTLNLTGTGDVTLGDVPWTTFRYALSRQRSRY